MSFHGLLSASDNTDGNTITAKILAFHGDKDPLVPVERVVAFQQEMTAAGSDWQMQIYGSAKHSFTNPEATDRDSGLYYDADADRRSWLALSNFLEELFG